METAGASLPLPHGLFNYGINKSQKKEGTGSLLTQNKS